ncbi:MAG: hypothetical protein ACTHXA_06030 [Gulosibacter sp.]|uniref:hypothetical protein n=1 Tax=Gulosibacter sp. TaxID=2817531 RepID=UPI003F93A134
MTDILLIGYGTIGQDLATLLAPELERGELRILGALVRNPDKQRDPAPGIPLFDDEAFSQALSRADLVVECAGVPAAKFYGPRVIGAGVDLLLTSVGALADPDARLRMLSGPGKLTV